jgi:hypothetical protein
MEYQYRHTIQNSSESKSASWSRSRVQAADRSKNKIISALDRSEKQEHLDSGSIEKYEHLESGLIENKTIWNLGSILKPRASGIWDYLDHGSRKKRFILKPGQTLICELWRASSDAALLHDPWVENPAQLPAGAISALDLPAPTWIDSTFP